eukprot:TRINITY_DN7392_c0_g1_i16.p1 TRINITY_DN7392_c0_g1~~TRINITY_DN7392_c0_g1_i16.p1  ORF type:complete len:504 (+),score=53.03 TRINITY_DN7392_c0_g1_i16:106-1617(+)
MERSAACDLTLIMTSNSVNDTSSGHEVGKGKITMDYFDTKFGAIDDVENPTAIQFAAALMRELLDEIYFNNTLKNLPKMNLEKFRFGAILLHIATRMQDFSNIYNFYKKISSQYVYKENVDQIEKKITEYLKSGTNKDLNDIHFKEIINLNISDENEAESPEVFNDIEAFSKENTYLKIVKKREKKKLSQKERLEEKSNTVEGFIEHSGTVEDKDRLEETPTYPCGQCDFQSVNGERNLEKHEFDAHGVGALCPKCGEKFQNFTDYEKHTLMHVYHCDKCNKPFAGIGGLRTHKRKHMPFYIQNQTKVKRVAKATTNVPCKLCGEEVNKKKLSEHIKEKHGGKELFSCEKCDYTSWNKFYLKDHVKRVHFLQHNSCTICGKVVKNLDKHIDRCHMTEGSHPCDQCGKLFAAKANLLTHIKNIHKQIKDYHCDQCTYSTYTKHNLRLHMKSHTGESTERECTLCGKTTNSLDWHINLFHKEEMNSLKMAENNQTSESLPQLGIS